SRPRRNDSRRMSRHESQRSSILDLPPQDRPLPEAWQPLTPRGVAAFSRASMGRLLFVQLVAASLVSGFGIWFLVAAWPPVLNEAIQQLPKTGLIKSGQLDLPRTSTEPLAENRFLALVMNVPGGSVPIVSSDVRLEFRRWRVAVCSRLGC